MRFAGILAVAATMGACSGGEPEAPVAEERVAAPAAVPEAPEKAPDKEAAAVLTAQGWGPLRIGMNLAEITAALGPDAEPDAVGGPDPEACDQFRPARAPQGVLVMVEAGRLTRVSLINQARIKTDRGLGLGDSAAAVRAAYGKDLVAMPHKYSDAPAEYLTAWAIGRPAMDVTDPKARGIRYEIGDKGEVAMIHAGGESIQYVEGCL